MGVLKTARKSFANAQRMLQCVRDLSLHAGLFGSSNG